ncbi:Cof-type HAD-IIB family hydrolase [Sporolactobacillus shoreae]|uniref:Cof-type HAD-IIB family hydrolase n=1 Tax=Sporolactobacillus shoreae TaxID=1465501 RepID=A0A4Z0GP79_9BACL|nr:Cof-type HAD-IIB family hydrolase [Sporolactobacillus shoreae]TGA97815.1 Cof-type HAD-IIB family hydrolase [Sporolactobacillus shoreae]
MYQTVMTDLDGTVLTPVNTVNAELTDYLKILRDRGVRIFAVTGRSLSEAQEVLPTDFPIEGIVTANGMSVYAGTKQIFQSALPGQLVAKLLHRAESEQLYYQLHPSSGGKIALTRDRTYFEEQIGGDQPESVSENEWLSRKKAVFGDMIWKEDLSASEQEAISKIYFFSKSVAKMDEWKTELASLSDEKPFDYFSSSHSNVEVNAKDISKASGIRILLRYFHLSPESALVFGDGENDLPMFQIAGHAVAMKNAPDHIKEQADEVTDFSYAENGLYHFLKKTFG